MSTAHAAPGSVSDGFENNPWNRWQALKEGDAAAGADFGGLARTGANNGWLYAANGWAAERRAVSVAGWEERENCTARIFAQPVAGGAQVGLQIWDPDGWRLLPGDVVPWLGGSGYQSITTRPVNLSGVDTVYVQAIFGKHDGNGQFVRLDDMTLQCGP